MCIFSFWVVLWWAIPPVRLGLSGRNSGKIPERPPETLSEHFREFPSRVRLGCPKPYNSRHLRLPERFQNSLPPSTAGDASFFRVGSGEGLSELVMESPAVLGAFLIWGSEHPSPHVGGNSRVANSLGPTMPHFINMFVTAFGLQICFRDPCCI